MSVYVNTAELLALREKLAVKIGEITVEEGANSSAVQELISTINSIDDVVAFARLHGFDTRKPRSRDTEATVIRKWALSNGYAVGTHGVLPNAVHEAYRAAVNAAEEAR